MLATERRCPSQRRRERRAKPARRSSRFVYPKTVARGLHQSRPANKNQNPQNGHLMARFDWGLGAVCFGASPVATVFGSAPGSATSPEHRIHSKPSPPSALSKQDISTLLGIGHFYFALTMVSCAPSGTRCSRARPGQDLSCRPPAGSPGGSQDWPPHGTLPCLRKLSSCNALSAALGSLGSCRRALSSSAPPKARL